MTKNQSIREEKIKEIMENFDFERTHKIMVLLNWRWQNKGVPTVSMLKDCARKLLMDSCDKVYTHVETGGFVAIRRGNDFSLMFCTDCWETESE